MSIEIVKCPSCGSTDTVELNSGNYICKSCETKFKVTDPNVIRVKVEETKWIVCEIVYSLEKRAATIYSKAKIKFWARSVGPNGSYKIDETKVMDSNRLAYSGQAPPIQGKELDNANTELNNLKGRLINAGWEYVGSYGTSYWQQRFRKKA